MTAPIFVSDINSNAANDDLPQPDKASTASRATALSQPTPGTRDTGRISFGAACRLPLVK